MEKRPGQTDTTPTVTKAVLLTVLAITAAFISLLISGWLDDGKPEDIVIGLWLFTVLFVLRVVGQIVVAIHPQQWLPPMTQWNFIPYPILLPIQLLFVAIMIWLNLSFSTATWGTTDSGHFLISFSYLYALAMVIRYLRRMQRHPDQRWFGGTIPIVFHFVLASYLYTLGRFYVFQ